MTCAFRNAILASLRLPWQLPPQLLRLPILQPMNSVAEHYANHLAPVYVWMAGGLEAALARGAAEIDLICPSRVDGLSAVDLGAGFGMHTIPLARRGYAVLAIDSSPLLLGTLWKQAGALPVRVVEGDLVAFPRHLEAPADLILCMGDTLTHLPELQDVEKLFANVAASLRPGGSFVATFRDYTTPLTGRDRFITVRSDAERILTCVLDYADDHVAVHDVIHELTGPSWLKRISAYRKLRLDPAWVAQTLQAHGLSVYVQPGFAGMLRVVATRVDSASEEAEIEQLRLALERAISERERRRQAADLAEKQA